MKVAAESVRNLSLSILGRLGIESREACVVADNLLKAEARGISTHGVNYLPMIAERVEAGLLKIPTEVTLLAETDAVTHLDGGNGLGQVAAAEAMRRAIEKARAHGIGMTLVRNTNNIGLLAYYSLMAASEGMIGSCMCNGAPSMAPWGGSVPFFGTNPFSVAAPGDSEDAIVLDMSTSVVARGKIRRALRMKQPIPRDWALDVNGEPTDDPEAAMKGTLIPVGGPKGYGMAFFIDFIVGLVGGSSFARQVSTFHQPISPTGVGVMALAISIETFMPLDQYRGLVAEHVQSIRSSPRGKNVARIYLPGEIEAEKEKLAAKEGIAIDVEVLRQLEQLLVKLDLDSEVALVREWQKESLPARS